MFNLSAPSSTKIPNVHLQVILTYIFIYIYFTGEFRHIILQIFILCNSIYIHVKPKYHYNMKYNRRIAH